MLEETMRDRQEGALIRRHLVRYNVDAFIWPARTVQDVADPVQFLSVQLRFTRNILAEPLDDFLGSLIRRKHWIKDMINDAVSLHPRQSLEKNVPSDDV